MKRLTGFAVSVVITILLTAVIHQGLAWADCRLVNGHVELQAVPAPPCTSPAGLCFHIRVTGRLQGEGDVTVTSLTPSPDLTIPSAFLFTSRTVLQTKHGDFLFDSGAGAGNFDAAGNINLVNLLTITGGTGRLAGASGHIFELGSIDTATGIGASDLKEGELCTP